MDKGIVKHGTVGVRLSTWRDADVQKQVPAYSKIEEISLNSRTLPRSRNLAAFAEVIDSVMVQALTTDEPSSAILAKAQKRIVEQKIVF
jgi:multiple sugar transport system substrate-binding protein